MTKSQCSGKKSTSYIWIRFIHQNKISGLESSGITVSVTKLSLPLLTTTFKGTPTPSPIISIICNRFTNQIDNLQHNQLKYEHQTISLSWITKQLKFYTLSLFFNGRFRTPDVSSSFFFLYLIFISFNFTSQSKILRIEVIQM